ncbi:hypothetical protein PInf_018610 [Phytophthora infestans]|nr:hypothetical protein PInf_018610 [Phytophthora infestans]
MVAPTPKTPRQHRTKQESRLCRGALTKAKKVTRKKAAKRTAADMEVAQYIPSASAQLADTAGEKESSRNQTIAEAKETIETTAIADAMEVVADYETEVTEVVADMVLSVETALPAQQSGITLATTDSSAEKPKA